MLETLLPSFAAASPEWTLVGTWALTYLMHSTLLLGAVWAATRWVPALRTPAAEDALWKMAAVGAILTATFQLMTGTGLSVLSPERPAPPSVERTAPPAPPSPDVAASDEAVPAPAPRPDAETTANGEPATGASGAAASPPSSPARSSATSPDGETLPGETLPWGAGLVAVWAIGAGGMALRRFGARWRFFARIGPRRTATEAGVMRAALQVARRTGVPASLRDRLQLTVSSSLASPIALAGPEICLPERALEMPDERLRSTLAHEWAHLVRRDPQWTWGLTLVECLLWIQPFNRVARRRQQAAAEHLCDAWVVERTGAPQSLAASLLDVADWMRDDRPALVAGLSSMAGTRSTLVRRVETLLDAAGSMQSGWSRWTRAAVALLMLGLVACAGPSASSDAPDAPSAPEAPEGAMAETERSVERSQAQIEEVEAEMEASQNRMAEVRVDIDSVEQAMEQAMAKAEREMEAKQRKMQERQRAMEREHQAMRKQARAAEERSGRNRHVVKWTDDGRSVEVEMLGEVELSGDGTGVASMAEDGQLRVKETAEGTTKTVIVTPSDDGSPQYAYTVNGASRAFGAAARTWMNDILVEAMRRTGFGADARVEHLLRTGGMAAVRDETEQLDSDVALRRYYEALLHSDVTDTQRAEALRHAASRIESDVEMRRVLERVVAERSVTTDPLFGGFVDALASIESDVEIRRVLVEVLEDDDLAPAQQERALGLLERVDSDVETRRILEALAAAWTPTDASVSTLVGLFGEIDSDVELRRIAQALMQQDALSPQQRARVLRAATARLDSDVELRRLLLDAAERKALPDPVFDAAMAGVEALDSDVETRRALMAFYDRSDLGADRLVVLLDAAAALDADHEKGRLLRAMSALRTHESERVRTAYRDAVASIDSDRQRERLQGREK